MALAGTLNINAAKSGVSVQEIIDIAMASVGNTWHKYGCTSLVWGISNAAGLPFFGRSLDYTVGKNPTKIDLPDVGLVVPHGKGSAGGQNIASQNNGGWNTWEASDYVKDLKNTLKAGDIVRLYASGNPKEKTFLDGISSPVGHSFVVVENVNGVIKVVDNWSGGKVSLTSFDKIAATMAPKGAFESVYVSRLDSVWLKKNPIDTVKGLGFGDFPSKISASISDAMATEGGVLKFTVSLDSAATENTKVYFETGQGTAGSKDFAAKNSYVEILKGQKTATIEISTTQDKTVEKSETLSVSLKSATAGVTIADSLGVGTILDDEKAADFLIKYASLADNTLTKGQALKVNLQVQNVGNADAKANTSLFWSKDATFDFKKDVLIATDSHGTLTAGELDKDEGTSISYKTLQKHGDGYIIAVIDYENGIAERNEFNNTYYRAMDFDLL